MLVLQDVPQRSPSLAHIWLDAGYQGPTVTWIEQDLGLSVRVVRKPRRWVRCPVAEEPPPYPQGFQVLPAAGWWRGRSPGSGATVA